MQTRTWPYGTQKRVRVLEAHARQSAAVVACEDIDGPREAYVLLMNRQDFDAAAPARGQLRTIVFTAGGPTGGFWKLEAGEPARPSMSAAQ